MLSNICSNRGSNRQIWGPIEVFILCLRVMMFTHEIDVHRTFPISPRTSNSIVMVQSYSPLSDAPMLSSSYLKRPVLLSTFHASPHRGSGAVHIFQPSKVVVSMAVVWCANDNQEYDVR